MHTSFKLLTDLHYAQLQHCLHLFHTTSVHRTFSSLRCPLATLTIHLGSPCGAGWFLGVPYALLLFQGVLPFNFACRLASNLRMNAFRSVYTTI